MVLEATVVCLDNSDWMRNGDFTPTRLSAQTDACNLVCSTKLRSNPENSVALLTMAEQREVLTTLTTDIGDVLVKLHHVKIGGQTDLVRGLQVAQLVLKHRQSKNHRQRIIAFVGSPLANEEAELVRLAKKFKKNEISVDIINYGEEEENQGRLEAFITTVNKNNQSHLVTIPSGGGLLSDTLISSPILAEENGFSGGGGGMGFEHGVDPSIDPELALALRISMEEEKQRQQRLANENKEGEGSGEAPMNVDESQNAASDTQPSQPSQEVDFASLSEEEQLAMALRMSLAEQPTESEPSQPEASSTAMDTQADDKPVSSTGQDTEKESGQQQEAEEEEAAPAFTQDLSYLQGMLGQLPGVDVNDPELLKALQEGNADETDKGKDDEESK